MCVYVAVVVDVDRIAKILDGVPLSLTLCRTHVSITLEVLLNQAFRIFDGFALARGMIDLTDISVGGKRRNVLMLMKIV